MTDILARQVLVAMGGDVVTKYGTAVWRKGLQSRGGETAYTFSRTGNGLYLANDVSIGGLKVLTASGGNARIEQRIDPVTGVLQNYWKLEPASVNSCLQSQALATGNPGGPPWATTALTATNNSTTAPDGTTTATYLVPTVANSLHYDNQTITITANEFLSWSGFVKSDGTYTGFAIVVSDASVTNGFKVGIDLTTGTLNIATRNFGTGTYNGAFAVALGGGWYYMGCWGAIGNGVTSANTFWEVFDTGAHANTQSSYAGDAVHGIYAWGAQLERTGTSSSQPPSSYMATGAGTASRNDEIGTIPWFTTPQLGMWIYQRFVERGAAMRAYQGSLSIGVSAGPKLYFVSENNNGFPGQYSAELWCTSSVNSITAPTGNSMPAVTYGQVVELLAIVGGTIAVPTLTVRQSINGGADVVATGSGNSLNAPLPSAWSANQLNFGQIAAGAGGQDVSRQLVGVGGAAIGSIADVRSIL